MPDAALSASVNVDKGIGNTCLCQHCRCWPCHPCHLCCLCPLCRPCCPCHLNKCQVEGALVFVRHGTGCSAFACGPFARLDVDPGLHTQGTRGGMATAEKTNLRQTVVLDLGQPQNRGVHCRCRSSQVERQARRCFLRPRIPRDPIIKQAKARLPALQRRRHGDLRAFHALRCHDRC